MKQLTGSCEDAVSESSLPILLLFAVVWPARGRPGERQAPKVRCVTLQLGRAAADASAGAPSQIAWAHCRSRQGW